MKQTKLLLLLLVAASLCSAQTTNFSFTNKPFSDPELNNYHRGAQYWNGTVWDNGGAPQVPNGTPTTGAKTFYRRYWWVECETNTQGVYKFTKASQPSGNEWRSIEFSLEWCANNGALFSFGGIMTAWDAEGEIFYDGAWSVYPEYLHNQMQAEPLYKDWKTNGYWVPNWNSQAYLDSWRRVNDTLLKYIRNWKYTPTSGPWAGKLVEGSKLIDFVDLRGYGNYGEWHEWPWAANDGGSQPSWGKPTDSSLKKIIDIGADVWGDYPLMIPAGVFDDNPWGEGTAFSAYWAMNRKTRYGVISWRRDNIGDPGLDNFLKGNTFTYNGWRADTAILARWKYGPTNGEPLNGCCGTCCPWYYHIRPEINDYHYSGFGNGNYGNTSAATFDTIRNVFKLTGYRFNLNGGSMPTAIAPNRDFTVSLNWRNVGTAPLYANRWRVVYDLKTQADVPVRTWIGAFTPVMFFPNSKDSVVSEIFDLPNIAPGTYKLTIKLEDTAKLLAPLFLALNNPVRNQDGSYTLRSDVLVTTALPVKWESFNVLAKDRYNLLEWRISCSKQSDRYVVERSDDGVTFYPIADVLAIENDCASKTYTYHDPRYFKSKYVYYRIKQRDLDGQFVYSDVKRLALAQTTYFKAVPNPTTGNLLLTLDNKYVGVVVYSLFDTQGRLVMRTDAIKNGNVLFTNIDISLYKTGIYTIKCTGGNDVFSIERVLKN